MTDQGRATGQAEKSAVTLQEASSSRVRQPTSGRRAQNRDGSGSGNRKNKPAKQTWAGAFRKDWRLYTLLAAPTLYFIVFKYLPMAGNVIAFRHFTPGGSIFGEYWVGFQYIQMFINDPTFWSVFKNTVILGVLTLVFSFPMPIIFALLLNELRSKKFKKIVQSISYLPHFMSVVIVVGMIFQLISLQGTINQLLGHVGVGAIDFMQQASWFRPVYVSSEVWQTMGWGAILYLAALTTIDESLYEAARIDGANRWKQTWHVTLPGISPMIMTLLILNIGSFMAVGFEKILLMYNPLTYSARSKGRLRPLGPVLATCYGGNTLSFSPGKGHLTMRHDTPGSIAARPPTASLAAMGPLEVATVGAGL